MPRLVFVGGGDILQKLGLGGRSETVTTIHGTCDYSSARIEGVEVFSLHRHEPGHQVAAHAVDYRRIVAAAAQLQPDCVFGVSICGSFSDDLDVGSVVFVNQLIDLTKKRNDTFYDRRGDVRHINVYEPVCAAKRSALVESSLSVLPVVTRSTTLVCIDGPRLSTLAELMWYRSMGADVVNMSLAPEAFLARELGLCYVSVSLVSDKADLSTRDVTVQDMVDTIGRNEANFLRLVEHLIHAYGGLEFSACRCANAPKEAIFAL